jgi:hypothetical protein
MPIIDPFASNPLVDGRQSSHALMVRRGVERHMGKLGYSSLAELSLVSGRRCDLICLSPKGEFVIIEVKSSIEDFRVDKKWPDYLDYCDRFFFATHAGVPSEIFPENAGLIIADSYGAEILRESNIERLNAARRKALLLRFARAATSRLAHVSLYAEKAGLALDLSGEEPADQE